MPTDFVEPPITAGEYGVVLAAPTGGSPPALGIELDSVLNRARAGDVETLPELRRVLDQHPELWRRYADLSSHVERRWIELIAGDNLCLKESLARKAADLRADLAQGTTTPVMGLLVDRVVTSWLEVQYFEVAGTMVGADVQPREATYMRRRLLTAQRRHLSAIKTLADVRRLVDEKRAGSK